MIKNIQRLRGFGIFDDYAKPADIADFAEKNVIYGWNYSGKTTLSRLFSVLETKTLPVDYLSATFSLVDHSGLTIAQDSLATCNKTVAVFNSDFVSKNLRWDGGAFTPILLLGDDSIEAEKKIANYEARIQQCREGFAKKRNGIKAIDDEIAAGKTVVAKQIKTTLNIVEPFTAVHLNQLLAHIAVVDEKFTMDSAELAADLLVALTPEKDKLPLIPAVNFTFALQPIRNDTVTLLSKKPSLSSTIEYLTTHANVSDWVEHGLRLHEEAKSCEFCGSELGEKRMLALRAHFSKDLLSHKTQLNAMLIRIEAAKLLEPQLTESNLNAQFRPLLQPLAMDLRKAITNYNEQLAAMGRRCAEKLASPFEQINDLPELFTGEETIRAAQGRLNQLIADSNAATENFSSEKKKANQRVRLHHSAQFLVDYKVDQRAAQRSRWTKHQSRYEKIAKKMQTEVKALQATIDRAQKGREKINERIAGLLGSESIQISVIKVGEDDRFQLTRGATVARNMSEGEKTAIAFAFFLVKLQEISDLQKVIVYIDDPISSLDSNHIFQLFSIIKTVFFRRDGGLPNGQWTTACKQLFVSTHNFEFFSLLRELPCSKNKSRYYLVKRVSATRSTLVNLPDSILKYSSEYHYLFGVIYKFYQTGAQADVELLLSLPNAVRRFLELYTYSKIPKANSTVDERAAILFGPEKALRITKVLHHFSHLGNIERLAVNTDLMADIENVVLEVVEHIKKDQDHFQALEQSAA